MLTEKQNLEVKNAMETAFRQMENNYNTEMDMDARNILFEEIDLITAKESVPAETLVRQDVPQPVTVAEIPYKTKEGLQLHLGDVIKGTQTHRVVIQIMDNNYIV